MVKQDEVEMYNLLYDFIGVRIPCSRALFGTRHTPRTILNSVNSPVVPKRGWYLLRKWSSYGWYDWGVTVDLGWFTDTAPHYHPETFRYMVNNQ